MKLVTVNLGEHPSLHCIYMRLVTVNLGELPSVCWKKKKQVRNDTYAIDWLTHRVNRVHTDMTPVLT